MVMYGKKWSLLKTITEIKCFNVCSVPTGPHGDILQVTQGFCGHVNELAGLLDTF